MNLLISMTELERQLGVSRKTIYKWCKDDAIPHLVLGRGKDGRNCCIRFNQEAINEWLQSKEV
jgi:excisionase family DNA binding protein